MAKLRKNLSLLLCFVLLFSTFSFGVPFSAYAETEKGAISSVKNVASGIKVTWVKDTSKDGYYVYRKAGSSTSWKLVKTISAPSYSSWTDKNTTNGTKYIYKVKSYKGSKKSSNSKTKTMYRLTTPTITKLSFTDVGDFYIKSDKNKKASGYVIKYSKSSSFSSSISVTVSGKTQLAKTVSGLVEGKKYYVKIRAYKKVNGVKYYSAYSTVKNYTTKKSYTAYTTNLYTNIYKKPDSNSTAKTIRYMSKVTLYGNVATYSSGSYKKLKYNGNYYYVWLGNGQTKFTKTKNKYDYTNENNTKYQQEVIDKAVYIFKNWDTEYVHGQSNGVKNSNGKYGFDCSGFVAYVFNTVMQQYVPTYKISGNIKDVYLTDTIYNNGYSSAFSAKTICKGSYDWDKLQPGDILFFNLKNGNKNDFDWNHCAIYLGNKQMIHSTNSADGVEIIPISDDFKTDFVKAVRMLPTKINKINKTKTLSKTTSIYDVMDSDTTATKIQKGEKVTLLFTNENWGYIKLEDGSYKFIYNPSEKFE